MFVFRIILLLACFCSHIIANEVVCLILSDEANEIYLLSFSCAALDSKKQQKSNALVLSQL